MKRYSINRLFYIASLLIAACYFTACFKPKPLPPTISNAKTDTISAKDTLPSFNSPVGLALDAAGNLYVSDYGNNVIRKITTTGIVSTFAGTGNEGALNGTAKVASFSQPKGMVIDASGNLYVADAGNNAIRKITTAGLVSTYAGSDSTGMADGPVATATFFGPSGVALDPSGNIYVADAGNNLIRMVSTAGVVSTIAGVSSSAFVNPTGIAINSAGNLFVANNIGNNILMVTPAGAVSTFAGSGQIGVADGPGSTATFYFPNSVAIDATNNVYVADGVNNVIRKITPAGVVSTLAGSGLADAVDGTGTAASFNGPSGLAVDAAGNVYVADTNNNLIRKITPGGVVTTVAGTGASGIKNGQALAHRNTIIVKSATNKQFNIWSRPRVN